MGLAAVFWIANTINSPQVETSITVAFAYFTFWLAEEGVHVSGVLSTVCLGLTLSRFKTYISVSSVETLHAFWEMMGFLINTLIFMVLS